MDVRPLKKLSWKRFFFIRFWVISVPLTRIWFLKATYFKFTLWISKLIKNLSSKDCCNEDLWEGVLSTTLLRSRIHLKDAFSLCFAQYVPLWLKFYLFFCDTFGIIGLLTVKLTASEKSITVRNKNMKNEQQQSSKEKRILKCY